MMFPVESRRVVCEDLESRRLLSGVTLVTHGFQPSSQAEGWVHEMALAIAKRAGKDTSVYRLRITGSGDDAEVSGGLELLKGKPLSNASHRNREAVIELDWAEASGVLASYTKTERIAELVTPFFTGKLSGIGKALAETPIHLIGHSRGGSVVSVLAKELGERGIWVDQMTLMDPFPVLSDAEPQVTRNVFFADNYYQSNGFPSGETPSGALKVDLSDTDFGTHSGTHDFYTATVRREEGGGFDLSRIGARSRPAPGIGTLYGGRGSREAVSMAGSQWPNLGAVTITSPTARRLGQALGLKFILQDRDSSSRVQWFLDRDTNPYNGTAKALTKARSFGMTGQGIQSSTINAKIKGVAAGKYAVMGKITDPAGNVRYAYADRMVAVKVDNAG